jgi:hypothetical protein
VNTTLLAAPIISRPDGRAATRLDALKGVSLQVGAGKSIAIRQGIHQPRGDQS